MITTVKKIKSIVFMFFVLTAFMGSAQSTESSGLEMSDLDGTWFKVKRSSKGYCASEESESLEKDKDKEKGYLYITYGEGGLDGTYVYLDDNKDWHEVEYVDVDFELGTVKKAILEVYIYDEFGPSDYVYSYYTVTLDTKEKKGSLKSGKLKTMTGYEAEQDSDGNYCVFNATLSGKTVLEKKVPEDVKSIVLVDLPT